VRGLRVSRALVRATKVITFVTFRSHTTHSQGDTPRNHKVDIVVEALTPALTLSENIASHPHVIVVGKRRQVPAIRAVARCFRRCEHPIRVVHRKVMDHENHVIKNAGLRWQSHFRIRCDQGLWSRKVRLERCDLWRIALVPKELREVNRWSICV
jgi:hypothetical protein